MKEIVSQREKKSRTLVSAHKFSQQPPLHSILQNYKRDNTVSQQAQILGENSTPQSIQRLVAQLASRVISFSVLGVPGDTAQGRNNYIGRKINFAYPGRPSRKYGFLQNGAVRVTITFSEERETADVQTALTHAGLLIGAIEEGYGGGLT